MRDDSGKLIEFLFAGGVLLFSFINSLLNPRKQRDGVGRPNVLLNLLGAFSKTDPATQAQQNASSARQAEIIAALKHNAPPEFMRNRLADSRDGKTAWVSTLSPAELLIARSHGIRPIAAVSATCWMHYGYSWTQGHSQGWNTALKRLKEEAKAAGANAVLDVKMRTVPIYMGDSMDFSLTGTAVKIDGLPPSEDPIVATLPALEFVKLLDANIVPTGIGIGANFQWITDWRGGTNLFWAGNTECEALSDLLKNVRNRAYYELRQHAKEQGTSALAHTNFTQMFEREMDRQPKQFLARHIVIATLISAPTLPDWAMSRFSGIMGEKLSEFKMVVDMHAGKTPLTQTIRHHQSYASNEEEGAI